MAMATISMRQKSKIWQKSRYTQNFAKKAKKFLRALKPGYCSGETVTRDGLEHARVSADMKLT